MLREAGLPAQIVSCGGTGTEEVSSRIRGGDRGPGRGHHQWIVGYADSAVCLHDEVYGVPDGVVETVWPILARAQTR